jgi:hypothetical protein
MKSCEQTTGLSVLQHGYDVNMFYTDIYNHVVFGDDLKLVWKLPDWLDDFKNCLSKTLIDKTLTDEYQIFHDCGKPYVVTVDDEGKRHFPNHSEMSYQVWLNAGGNHVVAELIRKDMDVHLLKDEGVEEFCKSQHATTLLLTGFAEIHANSQMFGGIDSTSFKIKWKHLNRRGKAIVSRLKA